MKILVINPGSTSTKIAVFRFEECILQKAIHHPDEEIAGFDSIFGQYGYRLKIIEKVLAENGCPPSGLSAIAARGGLLKPLKGGTYRIDEKMCRDLEECRYGEHASNLGAVIAYNLGKAFGIPAYVVDPVTVDELHAPARFSGLPEIPRASRSHALNIRAVAREASQAAGISFEKIRLIVAHLGSGTSVAAFKDGRMIDVSDPNNEGPFSVERCGALPSSGLVSLCYSGKYTEKRMIARITKEGGLYAYLGTKDFNRVEAMVREGHKSAAEVVSAMCYQIAKEIGAMSTVLRGEVDAIVVTGGMANSNLVVDEISARVSAIAKIMVFPGGREMEALAAGVIRVLKGLESARTY